MTPGARLAAAIEILTEIFASKSAADRTISAWGKARRFAGSKDRAAVAERVYTVLRRRNECAYPLDTGTARALVIGSLVVVDALGVDQIEALCTDGTHAPGALTPAERRALAEPRTPPSDQPWIKLNYPAWLHAEFAAAFGAGLETELAALNARAPLDLRANTLMATREQVMRELEHEGFAPAPCPYAANGIRLGSGNDAKITALATYREGRVEVQDEGSQLSVVLAGAKPGDTVIDLAAGAGGKALALSAAMANRGRLLACDVDPARLRQMQPRIARAGDKIIEIAGDPYAPALKAAVGEGADIVFVDAPCSGTGTWRRNPESKWTLDEARLKVFRAAQRELLDRAATLAKPGGRIVYVVCSMLPSEGREAIDAFLARTPGGWSASSAAQAWDKLVGLQPPRDIATYAQLSPARTGTDGFFAAILKRNEDASLPQTAGAL